MAKDLLTDLQCRNATTQGKKLVKLSDGDGLYLWVYEDGRKYWRLRYWVDGKEKGLSLGVYPAISLKAARKRRDDENTHLHAGRDPSRERQAEKLRRQVSAANTFEAVAREWYGKQKNGWVKHHADDVLRRLEKNLFPILGKRPIDEIESFELLVAVQKIEARGATDLAHRVLGVAGQVFRYGILPPQRCKRDLAADLRGALTPHKKKHQAAVKPEELPELMRAIATYDEKIGDRQTRLALELLALTFTRTNELIGAEWSEIDIESGVWIVPAERMKMKAEHIVPLSRQTKAIF
ncbi:MAG: integrase arm-type DNA-binding domain-containing protein, partial [Gallionellaceae bacterium]|nr:integrase arm-type DNA-binding domain-containing protein [Gallionellaceae bacterium]